MSPLRLLPLVALSFLSACGGSDDAGTTPVAIPPAPYLTCSDAGKAASAASALSTVCMLTTQGEIVIELYAAAPVTVSNFLKYVNEKRYDNTLYHRVAKNFVIQGGGFSTSGAPIATYAPIPLESNNGVSHIAGTIAMARTSSPDSATSQFFFNTVDNSACLNYHPTNTNCDVNGYAAFGKVIAGMDVINKIAAVSTDIDQHPLQPVVTYWATQLK